MASCGESDVCSCARSRLSCFEAGVLKMATSNTDFSQKVKQEQAEQLIAGGGGEKRKNYRRKKREVRKSAKRPNDIYIGEKGTLQSQVEKCKKLLDTKFNELFLHGLGQAIPRAMNVTIELSNFYQGTIDFISTTSTVRLIDDLIPQDEHTPPSYKVRNVSSIDIHIFRTVKIPN